MRKRLATYALAGTLGLTGVAGAALLAPAVSYAATGDSTALTERVNAIEQALAGLVTDGTLTQAQADEVATTLADELPARGGMRGGGPVDLAAVAKALGMTEAELRTAAQDGTTLADLAKDKGVSTDALVDALVTAAKARLAQAVTDGRLTQAEADERAAGLEAHLTEHLTQPLRAGRGHGGRGGHHGAPDGEQAPSATPSAEASSDSA